MPLSAIVMMMRLGGVEGCEEWRRVLRYSARLRALEGTSLCFSDASPANNPPSRSKMAPFRDDTPKPPQANDTDVLF
jgi:hypothetical protein